MEIANASLGSPAANATAEPKQLGPPKPAETPEKTASAAGPATKVDISGDARARLRAAKVAPDVVATINLKDSGAVASAVHKAKAARLSGQTNKAAAAYAAASAPTSRVA